MIVLQNKSDGFLFCIHSSSSHRFIKIITFAFICVFLLKIKIKYLVFDILFIQIMNALLFLMPLQNNWTEAQFGNLMYINDALCSK